MEFLLGFALGSLFGGCGAPGTSGIASAFQSLAGMRVDAYNIEAEARAQRAHAIGELMKARAKQHRPD
jgi:hypothetical protein